MLQKLGDRPLEHCPECGHPVHRILSPSSVVAGQSHRLKESNIEKAGFTQYRKIGKGTYEKTAGKGPGILRKED